MTARVLVVDDVPANVKLLEARLTAEYFEVVTASNGAEALDICARAKCDIVLLDVMMPGMDGPAVLARLRKDTTTAGLKVAFVTARAQKSEIQNFATLDAVGVIAKPFDPMSLASQVKELL